MHLLKVGSDISPMELLNFDYKNFSKIIKLAKLVLSGYHNSTFQKYYENVFFCFEFHDMTFFKSQCLKRVSLITDLPLWQSFGIYYLLFLTLQKFSAQPIPSFCNVLSFNKSMHSRPAIKHITRMLSRHITIVPTNCKLTQPIANFTAILLIVPQIA